MLCGALAVALAACTSPRRAAVSADTVAFAAPADSAIPTGPLGASIRRGQALLAATRDSLPEHVGAKLACTSCHPDAGRRANAMPWVGVSARYPQYRSRSASVSLLEDRINDCFERSMNGRALDPAGPDMRDIVSYMSFVSRGVPVGAAVKGQGLPKLKLTHGDSGAGRAVFATTCARCHGPDGAGTVIAPPLWGPESFNIGAGMARLRTAGAFIRYNMPYDLPGSLTDVQAMDVAAFVVTRPRPDFSGKASDWPNGGAPPDVAYETNFARQHPDTARR